MFGTINVAAFGWGELWFLTGFKKRGQLRKPSLLTSRIRIEVDIIGGITAQLVLIYLKAKTAIKEWSVLSGSLQLIK